jgi:aminoglycoside phosphotransferase (APT) family kinase protein
MIVATRLASENEVPVVRFRAFMSDSSLGRPVLVQEFRRAERASAVVQERSSAVDEIATVLGNWVAQIHAINRDHFGSVLLRTEGAWGEIVLGKVREALDFLPASVIPRSRSTIESAFSRVVACLPTDIVPSLVHGDLYLDNVLVEGTRPVTLLDFEHSYFADRFADFGKLEELLFGWFPASKLPFLEAYHHHFPPQDGDDSRYLLAIGLYELSQLAYFMRWQPELAPEYRDRLQSWLNRT